MNTVKMLLILYVVALLQHSVIVGQN